MIKRARSTKRDKTRRRSGRQTAGRGRPISSASTPATGVPPADDATVAPDDAVWLNGRVPNGFWDRPASRRRYMRWLGERLGFRSRQDWYRITTGDLKRNRGGSVLCSRWHDSAIYAVQDTYRDYDWKPWLFKTAPRHFWQDPENHRKYILWLGEQLGIREPSAWYHVTNQDFRDHGGGALLIHYHSTVSAAVMSCLPEYDWKEWMFDKTPKGFWDDRRNRRRYMLWLGAQLGFQALDDWYALTSDDFHANYGNQLLKRYGGSPIAALRDVFPRHTWHEWKFARVPIGFWDDLDNCRRYVRWLGRQLKIKSLRDWQTVRRRDLLENCGGGLLFLHHSYRELLAKCIPGLNRKPIGRSSCENRRKAG